LFARTEKQQILEEKKFLMRRTSAVSSHLTALGDATFHKSTPIAGVVQYRRFLKSFAY
jgi:hypothetical protein